MNTVRIEGATGLSTRFGDEGYLLLPGALPPEPCADFAAAALGEFARLSDAGWSFTGAGKLAGHLNIRMGEAGRALYAAFAEAGLPELVAQLAGEPVQLVQAVGNLNLPGSCTQDMHIDGAFANRILIANICLVPTTTENGATALIPGSDRTELSYWRLVRDGWRGRTVRPALQPGDVLIRPSNLWHAGTPNRTGEPRPMAAFAFAPARTAAKACTDLDGPLTIFANKYYGRWRVLKEFTAARLPLADEALRLGKSFLADRRRG